MTDNSSGNGLCDRDRASYPRCSGVVPDLPGVRPDATVAMVWLLRNRPGSAQQLWQTGT